MLRMAFANSRTVILSLALVSFSLSAMAASSSPPSGFQKPPPIQKRNPAASSAGSTVSYDINAAAGTYNSVSYYEINVGLNWLMADWLNWRNALFSRIPSTSAGESVSGLDSSLRLQSSVISDSGTFGMSGFIGPGVRIASKDANAAFGEAGLLFKLGGLNLGGGVKSLYYLKERTDSLGASLPRSDSQFFILISGSGNL